MVENRTWYNQPEEPPLWLQLRSIVQHTSVAHKYLNTLISHHDLYNSGSSWFQSYVGGEKSDETELIWYLCAVRQPMLWS